MIRILIADDHKMFREGLVSLLEKEEGISVLGQAANGVQALQLISELRPDIVLLDLEMPLQDGFEVMHELKNAQSNTRSLVLTMHKSPQFIKNILKAGAAGYLQKDVGKEKLVEAIQSIYEQGSYYTPDAGAVLIESLREEETASSISKREMEIIRFICDQLTTKEIAAKLGISKHTVESHRQNILLKLEVKNTAGLVKYAIQKGIV